METKLPKTFFITSYSDTLSAIDDLINGLPYLSDPVLTVSSIGNSSITLSWTNISATNYILQRATQSDYSDAVQIYSGADLTYDDSGLVEATTYFYRVRGQKTGYIDSLYATTSAGTLIQEIVLKSVDLELSSTQYLTIPDASQTGLDLTTGFTFEIWFKPEQLPSVANQSMVLMAKHPTGYLFSLTNSNLLTMFYSDGALSTQSTSSSAALVAGDVGNWTYFAVTVNASTKEIIIYKGSLLNPPITIALTSNSSSATSIVDNAIPYTIGANNNPAAYIDGKVADPRVWNTVRTASQLISNYKSRLNGNESGLVSNWRFIDDLTDTTSGNTLAFAGTGTIVYSTDFPYSSGITITPINKKSVFQRNDSGEQVITISGKYYESAVSIEARIVLDGTTTEVVTWTVIDASLLGGAYSGTLTVPEGGWYNMQVRKSDQPAVTVIGNTFGVGIVIGVIGQSLAHGLFTSISSPDTPNALLSMHNKTSGWVTCTGNGAIKLGNMLATTLSLPIGLLDYGVGGAALYYEARGTPPNDLWWLDEIGHTSSLWDDFVTANGLVSGVEYILWIQGEQDASSTLITQAEYVAGLTAFRANQIVTEIGEKKMVFGLVSRNTGGTPSDADWQGIKDAQIEYYDANTSDTEIVSNIDLAMVDSLHLTSASYGTAGLRYAQAILFYLGQVSYYRSPRIASFTVTGSNTVDVNITHVGGTDFTPTSGITGFTASDGSGSLTITAAARKNATQITLTFNRTISGTVLLRHLYGKNPTVTSIVKDNSGLTLPLLTNSNITEV